MITKIAGTQVIERLIWLWGQNHPDANYEQISALLAKHRRQR